MTRLTFEYDPEPYGKERDGAIIKMAQEFGVETIVRNSHTLYNLDRFETKTICDFWLIVLKNKDLFSLLCGPVVMLYSYVYITML